MIKIYACGGAGINVANHFEAFRGSTEKGFSQLDITYIDSSASNVGRLSTSKDNIYLLDNTNGSGKKRALNYDEISVRAQEILLKYKPEEINIVLHSFSGGSGSVIGPVLVSEMLARKKAVIVIGIGGSDSRIEADNTLNTIRSYTAISRLRQKSVPTIYYENSSVTPRGKVDQSLYTCIVLLSVYFSGQNHELDYTDLYNFLNYNEVTEYEPKLSYLEYFTGDIELERDHSLISVATLSDASTPTGTNLPVEYQCTGFIDEDVKAKIGISVPIHLCVIDGTFTDIVARLMKCTSDVEQIRKARVSKTIDVDLSGATDEGIVL
jgi:hypothetical protein